MFRITLLLILTLSTNIFTTKAGCKRKRVEEDFSLELEKLSNIIKKHDLEKNSCATILRTSHALDNIKLKLQDQELRDFCYLCADKFTSSKPIDLICLHTNIEVFFAKVLSKMSLHKSTLQTSSTRVGYSNLRVSLERLSNSRQYGHPDLDEKTKLEIQKLILFANMRVIKK